MKRILFIDRDGTLIYEPPDNFRVDSFEKLRFLPGVIYYLRKIREELKFTLVMVTNQDGLGTEIFPEETFWPVQDFIMKTLDGEKISFNEVCIDRSFEHENKPTRKPNTGMLTKYMQGDYDLANSFVIGDRITDMKLAQHLGTKSMFIRNYDKVDGWEDKITKVVDRWEEIYNFLTWDAMHSVPT
jgi:imidazoleglycerol-phosphate dehydratase / histidinol-phosphatase